MDTSEKLKALHEHCNRHKACQSCILNGACCRLNYIDDKITSMYETIKTWQNAAAPTEDMPTEDGTLTAMWKAVIKTYAKKGLNEETALIQA